jgi:hypothetical protein
MCGIVAILGLLPFTFRVLTAWRTIVFSRPANLLITIHSIPIYGHTHLSMLRSSELHQVCAYPVQKGFISDHRTRARTSIPELFAELHPTIGTKIGTRRLYVHPAHPGNAAVAWVSSLRPHRKRPEHLACLIGFSQFQRLWPNKTETLSGGFRQLYSPIQAFSQPRSVLGRQLHPPPTVRCRPIAALRGRQVSAKSGRFGKRLERILPPQDVERAPLRGATAEPISQDNHL